MQHTDKRKILLVVSIGRLLFNTGFEKHIQFSQLLDLLFLHVTSRALFVAQAQALSFPS